MRDSFLKKGMQKTDYNAKSWNGKKSNPETVKAKSGEMLALHEQWPPVPSIQSTPTTSFSLTAREVSLHCLGNVGFCSRACNRLWWPHQSYKWQVRAEINNLVRHTMAYSYKKHHGIFKVHQQIQAEEMPNFLFLRRIVHSNTSSCKELRWLFIVGSGI